jgi:glutamate/tyrosine decarboxylase-like PLP-dependent enzyme
MIGGEEYGQLFFTSSGTESNNLAILGAVKASKIKNPEIIVSDSEHPAVLNTVASLEKSGVIVHLLKTVGGVIDVSELKSVLSSRGLSAEFADIVVISDNIEESQANIDKLDKLFKKAVQTEIEKRLAGNAPKGNTGTAELTKESAKKMSLADMNKLAQNDPDKFKSLFG